MYIYIYIYAFHPPKQEEEETKWHWKIHQNSHSLRLKLIYIQLEYFSLCNKRCSYASTDRQAVIPFASKLSHATKQAKELWFIYETVSLFAIQQGSPIPRPWPHRALSSSVPKKWWASVHPHIPTSTSSRWACVHVQLVSATHMCARHSRKWNCACMFTRHLRGTIPSSPSL